MPGLRSNGSEPEETLLRTSGSRSSTDDLARIAAMGAVLAVYLARVRVYQALALSTTAVPLQLAGNIAVAMRSDLAYVICLTGGFGGAVWLARLRPGIRHALVRMWIIVVGLSVVLALVNRLAVIRLGQPLSYQWLYYSDFLMGLDAYNTMAGLLSWRLLAQFAANCAAVVILGLLAGRLLASLVRAGRARIPLALSAGVLALYFPLTAWLARAATLPLIQVRNPAVFLIGSAIGAEGGAALSTMPTAVGPDDFLMAGERPAGVSPLAGAANRAKVRNVIIFMMESVPARFIGLYGGPPGLTPEIDAAGADARIFTKLYAHVPSTAHSMVSLLLSAYPPHSFRILTREFPRIRLPSLSSELEERGYRTAFFNAADNRFQRGEEFLAARRFDLLADHRSIPCAHQVFIGSTHDWPFLDGTQDGCAVAGLLDWAGTSGPQPFAAVLWTMQTHDPYFVSSLEGHYARAGSRLNRYLSALHEGDRALGDLLRGLAGRGLLESTLVIVMGDHGEAFGQHAHTNHHLLYEEDLHIPLLLINERLFHGERDSTVGGIIDVAPTIMDLLGYPLPARWQGRSLFDPQRSGRVYFFAPFSSAYFGYLEGSRKLIYNASSNTAELYDLHADPGEKVNLAPRAPEAVAAGRERLVTWARYQEQYYSGLLDRSVR
jgi:lipoteichoic acid synthase